MKTHVKKQRQCYGKGQARNKRVLSTAAEASEEIIVIIGCRGKERHQYSTTDLYTSTT